MASNKRVNKAYVRYDGTGRVISGSLILNRFKPKVGNWQEIPAYECCNPSPSPALPLRMLFLNIEEIGAIVGDVNSVTDWNTFFDLPTYGNPFTSVSVNGNTVFLYGGAGITLKDSMFDYGDLLVEIDDQAGCVVSTEYGVFYQNNALTLVNLPAATVIGSYCFNECFSLTSINLSSCTDLGGTVSDDGVFNFITGNTIALTISSALMTCDSGNPDGDIVYLQANNTVTIVTV